MILDTIVADKKERLRGQKAKIPLSGMQRLAEGYAGAGSSFLEGLKKPGISIIGEFKKASPSLGTIQSKIDLKERIAEYNAAADCISCLTEEDHFHGNTGDLKAIRAISPSSRA